MKSQQKQRPATADIAAAATVCLPLSVFLSLSVLLSLPVSLSVFVSLCSATDVDSNLHEKCKPQQDAAVNMRRQQQQQSSQRRHVLLNKTTDAPPWQHIHTHTFNTLTHTKQETRDTWAHHFRIRFGNQLRSLARALSPAPACPSHCLLLSLLTSLPACPSHCLPSPLPTPAFSLAI